MGLSINNKTKVILLSVIIAFYGCQLLKTTANEIVDSYFVCHMGDMVGNTTLLFKDSTFIYSERGGLFGGEGKWYISSDGKYLILNGVSTLANHKGTEMELKKEINIRLRIKGKNKLISDDCVFYRE